MAKRTREELLEELFYRTPPSDMETEHLLLGALLLAPDRIARKAFRRMRGEHFHDWFNGWLFNRFRFACLRKNAWRNDDAKIEHLLTDNDRLCRKYTRKPLFNILCGLLGVDMQHPRVGEVKRIDEYCTRIITYKKHRDEINRQEGAYVDAWNRADDACLRQLETP